MNEPSISLFLVDDTVRDLPGTVKLLGRRPDVPVVFLEKNESPRQRLEKRKQPPNKTIYHLTHPQGRHFKKCPGITEHYACCNLHVLDQAENCPLSCTYCFLQGYLTENYTTLYMDYTPLFDEIRLHCSQQPRRLFRVGTGELSDSLALDHLTGFSRQIIPFFASLSNAVLELKTKSDRVDNLLNLEHRGRTVVAWTLNPPAVNEREELGCAPVAERLRAAGRAAGAGYPVAFHFDPMIYYEGCEKDYARLMEAVFDVVPAEQIAWLSVGSIRFNPDMRQTVMEKFPQSRVMLGEIVRGYDGKGRYFKPIRQKLYTTFFQALRGGRAKNVFVYFCMENNSTWERFMGWAPENNAHLDYLFAESLYKRFPGLLSEPPRRHDYIETVPVPAET